MRSSSMPETVPDGPVAGAEIRGLDPSAPLQEKEIAEAGKGPDRIRHPGGGRHALCRTPALTLRFEGRAEEESRPLLAPLHRHAARPGFPIRVQWQPGSIAFRDSRAPWHYTADDDPGEQRPMHRIAPEGEAPS